MAPLVPQGRARRGMRALYHAVLGVGRGIAGTLPGGETVRVLPEKGHIGWSAVEYAVATPC